jgi:hypothetical protein
MYRDRTYQAGALAGVTGSLSWTEAKGNIGLMLKIIGADFPNASKLDMTPTPFSVVHGFVTVDGKAVAPHGFFPLRTANGILRGVSDSKLSINRDCTCLWAFSYRVQPTN